MTGAALCGTTEPPCYNVYINICVYNVTAPHVYVFKKKQYLRELRMRTRTLGTASNECATLHNFCGSLAALCAGQNGLPTGLGALHSQSCTNYGCAHDMPEPKSCYWQSPCSVVGTHKVLETYDMASPSCESINPKTSPLIYP